MQSKFLNDIRAVTFVKDKMHEFFGNNMELLSENVYLQHHGWFMLKFIYKPENYLISFEAELNGFDLCIDNPEGQSISLNRQWGYRGDMTRECMEYAIAILSIALEKGIDFSNKGHI